MNYNWEAEKEDGTIITEDGRDLTNFIKLSFIPNNEFLPQHDIIGVKMKRRFDRTITKNIIGKNKKVFILHCVVCEGFRIYLNDDTGVILATPEDYEVYL
jgi:hypothetical protein